MLFLGKEAAYETGLALKMLPKLDSIDELLQLLVADLGRPERFWRLMLKPNTDSWLVKGAWVLGAFGALTTASLAAVSSAGPRGRYSRSSGPHQSAQRGEESAVVEPGLVQ